MNRKWGNISKIMEPPANSLLLIIKIVKYTTTATTEYFNISSLSPIYLLEVYILFRINN